MYLQCVCLERDSYTIQDKCVYKDEITMQKDLWLSQHPSDVIVVSPRGLESDPV